MSRLLTLLVLALLMALSAPVVAQSTPCRFVLGFQTLHDALATVVGDCKENEHDGGNGDRLQAATGGLLVWRKADNWTAFTDGYRSWINGPNGLQLRLNSQRFPWETDDRATSALSSSPNPTASAPSPIPAAPPTVIVNVGAGTFSPATISLPVGGTVTWLGQDGLLHSAQSLPGAPVQFNTGPINNFGAANFTFVIPGTYPYTSGVDCLLPGGGQLMTFNCGQYVVIVTGSSAPAAQSANVAVTVDEQAGFTPANLTVASGQTVTWVNRGTNTHSIVSNSAVIPTFDSGGIGPGQSFSYTFTGPAMVGYHSSTEPTYRNDSGLSFLTVVYKYNGAVSVLPPR